MSEKVKKVEEQFVEVFVKGVSMSGEAEINDNNSVEQDKEKPEREESNNSE
jgi:hypothetical protein|tara:strand:- start:173 stop:325 length:153 start_codon:yes stop_codon:yes gene_type:complete